MKKLIAAAIAVIVILIIVVVAGVSNLGPIVKNAVNTYGPDLTRTRVSVADVDVSLLSGKLMVKNFFLGNPKGFKSQHAMSVASLYVDVDEGSLATDTIIVDTIEIQRPDIIYEKGLGSDNFKKILENISSGPADEQPAAGAAEQESQAKKIIIRNFVVREGRVTLSLPAVAGANISAPLPDIHLENIGQEKGGVTPREAFTKIFAYLYDTVTSASVTDTLNKGLEAVGGTVKNVGAEAARGVEKVGGKIKGFFGK